MSDTIVPDLEPRRIKAQGVRPVGGFVYIETYGCQMNVYDTQIILDRLATVGIVASGDHLTADVILLNTCSVREHAEHRVLSRLRELRRLREEAGFARALLVICGCMAERLRDELLHGELACDLVVGVDRYDDLPTMLGGLMKDRSLSGKPLVSSAVAVGHNSEVHYVAPPELYPTNNSHLVTIHKGCDYRCSYCIVPYTRGPQSEKPPALILKEIRAIVAGGGAEVTLLGQNVTAYRWRKELGFSALLELILRETDVPRVRFLTGHPCDMHPHLMELMGREPRLCPWLHVPAQSGSDRILERMKRRYTRQQYLDMVATARRTISGVTFSSDVIVGFPGEQEDDFTQTLDLIRTVGFDSLFAFKYSPRPGAPSAALTDDVPLAVKKRRLGDVLALQAEIWECLAASQVGRVWHAIVEGPARRPKGYWRLRTACNRKVVAPLTSAVAGQQREIRVTGFKHTTFLGVETAQHPRSLLLEPNPDSATLNR